MKAEELKEKIQLILCKHFNDEYYMTDAAVYDIIFANEEYYKQRLAEMMPSEVKEAMKFIEKHPKEDDFMAEHVKIFMGADGEPTDNSIELIYEWNGKYMIIINWFKSLFFVPTWEE